MNYIYTELDNRLNTKVTIFSIPKPFHGHIGIIQSNAIHSWKLLIPEPEIILFGDEPGTKEICQQLDLIHISQIDHNEYGTPLLNSVFSVVHRQANTDIIVYINADIILTKSFSLAIQSVSAKLNNYLLIGRRWDIEIYQRLEFNSSWETDLEQLIQEKGCLGDYDCKDYFVFPKQLFANIPRFAVGRGYWDTWMVNQALADGYPVVDGSLVITAIHQNHPYTHIRGGRNEAYMGREAEINKTMGNVSQPGNIACATRVLKPFLYINKPAISIIIIAQNNSINIEKVVLSVLIQNYTNYEIIVINYDCNEAVNKVLKRYSKDIRYYDLEKSSNIDPFIYGLNLAEGEFMLFLDEHQVLLPKILGQLMNQINLEASTLDVLLAGDQIRETRQFREYLSWNNSEVMKSSSLKVSDIPEKSIDKNLVIFRSERFKLLANDFNSQIKISNIIYSLISERGCRAKHF